MGNYLEMTTQHQIGTLLKTRGRDAIEQFWRGRRGGSLG